MLTEQNRYFGCVSARGGWSTERRLRYYCSWLFAGVNVRDRRILDVGGGSGVFALYAASFGAKTAVCLEPELEGSTTGSRESFNDLAAELGLKNAKLIPTTLQNYSGAEGPFDIILLHNSINHVDEEACIHLAEGGIYRERYLAIARRIAGMAAPGCKLIICDCNRRNFFHDVFGCRSPFAPTIEWEKHQEPEVWIGIFKSVGFKKRSLKWTAYGRLGAWGAPLRLRIIQYFLLSHFKLTLEL